MIQILVNCTKRVGTSSVTGNKWVAFRLGLRMIALIVSYRLRSWISPKRLEAISPDAANRPLPTVDRALEPDAEDAENEEIQRSI